MLLNNGKTKAPWQEPPSAGGMRGTVAAEVPRSQTVAKNLQCSQSA